MGTEDRTPERIGFGMRLKAARENVNLDQATVASRFEVSKKTVSAWETGRGDPGAMRLRDLAKLYKVSADSLLWEDSLSPDAMKFAADFDNMPEHKRRQLRALWMAFIAVGPDDDEVERKMPATKPNEKA